MSDADRAALVRRWFSGHPSGPFIIQLNPTMACNLNCLFCRRQDDWRAYYRTQKELPDRKYLEIVSDAISLGVRAVNIKGGGEPLLRRRLFRQLIPLIKSGGLSGSLITNATLIDEKLAEAFVQSRWDEISVSLDGADAQTHDYIRDKAGTFALVMAAIGHIQSCKRLLKSPLPHLKFHLVLTNRNFRCLMQLAHLAAEQGVGEVEIDSLYEGTPAAKPLALSGSDLAGFQEVLPAASALADRLGLRHNFNDFLRQGCARRSPQALPAAAETTCSREKTALSRLPCYFPWFHVTITPDGRMAPCCYGEGHKPEFDLQQLGFKSAWLDAGMRQYREAMLTGAMLPFCRDCTASYRDHNNRIRGHFSGED